MIALSAFSLTSCIEETFPEDSIATSEQVGASPSALEGSLRGIPSQMAQGYLVYGSQVHETDMGYPQYMIGQTEMLGDMLPLGDSGYDWYSPYNSTSSMSETGYYSYLSWFTAYKFIKTANDIIASVDLTNPNLTDVQRGAAGVAYACRAFNYLQLTVYCEPKANIYTDCSNVLGLTVPKVIETTDNETAKNNPRLTHDEMIAFMLGDLEIAEECLANYTPENKMLPNLAVVYGIKARVYMWDEDYANAAIYARKAIDASGASPVTEAQWNDVNTGFNTANQAWMWYVHYDPENMGNLCNFTGWMSGEADWGYSSLTKPGIDKSLYDKIADNDFRKYSFLDPARYDFYSYESPRGESWIMAAPDYLSLKFRCRAGDYTTYSVGGAVDVPVMRVEEMYLIEAEAVAASQSVDAGKALLSTFMQTYRQSDYECTVTELRDFQLEVLTQMRIEFWGEGTAFPAAKRLESGVMQNYAGTNYTEDALKINCYGIKPNWNMVIPNSEVQANVALQGFNNPNPTKVISTPCDEGVYAPANF